MMTARIKKQFKGYLASIRNYIAMERFSKNLTLRTSYENSHMDLTPETQRNGLQSAERSFKSRFNNRKYRL